jgi:DnaJ like chaperone protein
MILGRLLGTLFGFFAAGPLGALIGFAVGYCFDKGLLNLRGRAHRDPAAESAFFATVFTVMGQMAKADGRISAAEIDRAERLMTEFGFSADRRREAIALFKRGAAAEFELEPQLAEFQRHCAPYPELKNLLFEYLVALAFADGVLHEVELELLRRVAVHLGFHSAQFEQLLAMLRAQQQFHRGDAGAPPPPPATALADAYRALGVNPEADDRDIKTAFRRLMSQHHPDKMIARGVPAEMVKMATAKTQEIRAAYDLIRRTRRT